MTRTNFPWALLDNSYNDRFQKLKLQEGPVRQLEAAAFAKMRRSLENQTREVRHFLG